MESKKMETGKKLQNAKILVEILAIILGLFTGGFTAIVKYQDYMAAKLQLFHNFQTITEVAGIEYVAYQLSSDPAVQGYHVKPYSFVKIDTQEGDRYIFLENYFSQKQYTADENGICILLRQNTEDELEKMILQVNEENEIKSQTILVIQYVFNEKQHNDFFELRNGELKRIDDKAALKVIDNYFKKDTLILDMEIFPCNKFRLKNIIQTIIK